MDELYKMNCHDELFPNTEENIRIIRVPGGWIYHIYEKQDTGENQMMNYQTTSTFVPFDNEFVSTDKDFDDALNKTFGE